MFRQLGRPTLEILTTNQESPDLEDHAINIKVAQLHSNSLSRCLCLGSRRVLHLRRAGFYIQVPWEGLEVAESVLFRFVFMAKSHHHREGGQEDHGVSFPED